MTRAKNYATVLAVYNEDAESETLSCLCWCGKAVVWVPRAFVRQGITLPCSRSKCQSSHYATEAAHLDAFAPTEAARKKTPAQRRAGPLKRFNPSTYVPATDSSPSAPARSDAVVLIVNPGNCHCGCEKSTYRHRARFLSGHDTRLRGILIRAATADVPIVVRVGEEETTHRAVDYAERYNTSLMNWKNTVAHSAKRHMMVKESGR